MDKPIVESDIIDISLFHEAAEGIRSFQRMLAELILPIKQIISLIPDSFENIKPVLLDLAKTMTEAGKAYRVIETLGDAQFVYWDYLPSDFAKAIEISPNTNKTLREWSVVRGASQVNETISNTCGFPLMQKHLRLYTQSIDAFRRGHSDLAVAGLTSVFDGLLAELSNNPTHKLKPRIQTIMEKLKTDTALDHDEYSTLALVITLEKTLDSYSEFGDFAQKEPKGLNRHWIAHGRSMRKKTKLDCVKMIHLIYGMLLVSKLTSEEITE